MNYPKNRYTGEKPWMNYNWLYNEYVTKDRSSQEIADEYGCKQSTIQSWLYKHSIKKEVVHRKIKRTAFLTEDYLYNELIVNKKTFTQLTKETGISADTIAKYSNKYNIEYKRKVYRVFNDEDMKNVIDLYVNEKIPAYKIGEIYNTDHSVVIRSLQRYGINTRGLSESQFVSCGIDINEHYFDKEWLYEQYCINHLNTIEIAEIVGCSPSAIGRQLKRFDILLRDSSESKIGIMCGEKHPNWKGGVTPLNALLREYFHINLVPKIAKRDNYTCQYCGKQHTVLHIHHIIHFADIVNKILLENPNYNLINPKDVQYLYKIITEDNRFLDEDNLITLCKECHQEVHRKNKTISSQASFDNEEGSTTISKESTL